MVGRTLTPRLSDRRAQTLAWMFFATTVLLALSLAATWIYIRRLTLAPVETPPPAHSIGEAAAAPVSPLLLRYQLDLPGRGEIFPALTQQAADYWPVAMLSINNTSNQPVVQIVRAEVPGWSQRSQQTLVVGPRESRKVPLQPELLPRTYRNEEVRRVSLEVEVSTPDHVTFVQSRPVLLHAASDLYWGRTFSNAQFVARWVTPHDRSVLELVSQSRRYVPNGRLPGYNLSRPTPTAMSRQVRSQALAVYRALQRSGISYVSSIFTFGEHPGRAQRIRLPSETLSLRNANCMDVSVVFASAMENLGMHPVLIIVPGHAFTGVRLGPDSDDVLYLDLTVLPKGSFQAAINRAQSWLKKTPREKVITVDVAAARALGIYPLPTPAPADAEKVAQK